MIGERTATGNVLRHLLLLAALLAVMPPAVSQVLPPSRDLSKEARRAACNGQPLVVLFASRECPYCHVVRELYLAPLLEENQFPGIVISEIEIDSDERLRDFSGKERSMRDLAGEYGVSLVPDVAFFGPDGRMLVDSMVGIGAEDFYGAYLDQAIWQAGR